MPSRPRRRPGLSAALASALLAGPAALVAAGAPVAAQTIRGHADAQAEAFVQSQANKVIAALNDNGMSVSAKKRLFRQEVDQVADVPRITRFVLGKYARSISPTQYTQFADVFREYADNVYESRLNQYKGQRVTVTGSVARTPDDVVVASGIGGQGAASPVLWRVIRSGGRWRAVDVQVSGVWLAITEQQDFVSTLDGAGGDINVLIRQLRSQAGRAAA